MAVQQECHEIPISSDLSWLTSNLGITYVILAAMKTAISLPDDLFRMGEAAARRLRMSRSKLYAAALSEFLERRRSRNITERLNKIYAKEPSELDAALHAAQIRSLGRDNW